MNRSSRNSTRSSCTNSSRGRDVYTYRCTAEIGHCERLKSAALGFMIGNLPVRGSGERRLRIGSKCATVRSLCASVRACERGFSLIIRERASTCAPRSHDCVMQFGSFHFPDKRNRLVTRLCCLGKRRELIVTPR